MTSVTLSDTNITDKIYNKLILNSGIFGIEYLGALTELYTRGHLSKINSYSCAGGGSIIAGALACGASIEMLTKEFLQVDLDSFTNCNNKLAVLYNLYNYYGLCRDTYFKLWYRLLIEKLTGNADITLKQVYQKYNNEIDITAMNISKNEVIRFNYKTYPDLSLCAAVTMSSNIALVFNSINFNNNFWTGCQCADEIDQRSLKITIDNKSNNNIINIWSFLDQLLINRSPTIKGGIVISYNNASYFDMNNKKNELIQIGREAVNASIIKVAAPTNIRETCPINIPPRTKNYNWI